MYNLLEPGSRFPPHFNYRSLDVLEKGPSIQPLVVDRHGTPISFHSERIAESFCFTVSDGMGMGC